MRKDEILAKSGQDNKQLDERERGLERISWSIACFAGILTVMFFVVFNLVFYNQMNSQWMIIISIMWAAKLFTDYITIRKKWQLILAIAFVVGIVLLFGIEFFDALKYFNEVIR